MEPILSQMAPPTNPVRFNDQFHQNRDPDGDAIAAHRARVFDGIQRILRR